MPRRTREWNIEVARELQNPKSAGDFLLKAIGEGVPMRMALAKVVRATGVKEFAAKVGMPSPNVLRAIDLRHHPRVDTLERLLRPLGLQLTIGQITNRTRGPRRS